MKVASQQAVADLLGLSWDEVHAIQHRAVACGLARRKAEVVEHIGVDEKSFTRGHRYFTLVNDLDRGRVLFVTEDPAPRKHGSVLVKTQPGSDRWNQSRGDGY